MAVCPMPSLRRDSGDVLLDGGLADLQRYGDADVRFALGHRGEHLAFAWGEVTELTGAAATAEHPTDDLGVQRAAARGNTVYGVDERGDVSDALFEEVADAFGAVSDEVQRVGLLVVLREHEHAHVGKPAAQLGGGDQPVVLVPRRHLHVDDDDVGTVRKRLSPQIIGIAGLGDDIATAFGEQAGETFAQQHVVLSDHHAQPLRHPEDAI